MWGLPPGGCYANGSYGLRPLPRSHEHAWDETGSEVRGAHPTGGGSRVDKDEDELRSLRDPIAPSKEGASAEPEEWVPNHRWGTEEEWQEALEWLKHREW